MTGLAIVCAILVVAFGQAALWDADHHRPHDLPQNGLMALALTVLAMVFGVLGAAL